MDFEKELPKLFEFMQTYPASCEPGGLFFQFEQSLVEKELKFGHYRLVEIEIEQLDPKIWIALGKKVSRFISKKHDKRSWQQVFDSFNEAKAYNYLKLLGANQIELVNETNISTPDFVAILDGQKIACECKTFNRSEITILNDKEFQIQKIQGQLDEKFFAKLMSVIRKAESQIINGCEGSEVRGILYCVLNFDESLHEYADRYLAQIYSFLDQRSDLPRLEYVFDVKAKFSNAMRDPPKSNLHVFSTARVWSQIER